MKSQMELKGIISIEYNMMVNELKYHYNRFRAAELSYYYEFQQGNPSIEDHHIYIKGLRSRIGKEREYMIQYMISKIVELEEEYDEELEDVFIT